MKALAIGMIYGAVLALIATIAVALYAISYGDYKYLPIHIVLMVFQGVIIGANLAVIRMNS